MEFQDFLHWIGFLKTNMSPENPRLESAFPTEIVPKKGIFVTCQVHPLHAGAVQDGLGRRPSCILLPQKIRRNNGLKDILSTRNGWNGMVWNGDPARKLVDEILLKKMLWEHLFEDVKWSIVILNPRRFLFITFNYFDFQVYITQNPHGFLFIQSCNLMKIMKYRYRCIQGCGFVSFNFFWLENPMQLDDPVRNFPLDGPALGIYETQ